jgi:MscS family membrane protein
MRSAISTNARLRLRPALACALLLAAILAGDARAQAPAEETPEQPPAEAAKPTEEDLSRPMGPPDPFNRGTPRGSMYGYLTAARANDYERAAEFLDLRQLPPEERGSGPELARRLKAVLDQTLWVDVVNLPTTNEGRADDSLPAWQDSFGEIKSKEGYVTLLMQRVPREGDGVRIWKVASSTVARVPELYAEFEPVWLEEWLPSFFFKTRYLEVALWKWISLVAILGLAALVALLIAGTATRVLGTIFTRGQQGVDRRIVELVQGPVRLALTVMLFAVGQRSLGLSLAFADTLRYFERFLLVLALAWFLFRMIDLAALALRMRAEQRGNVGVLPVLVPGARFAKIVIVLIGGLAVLGTLGVNVSAAVAGLGVGGIAVALAAQKSLENLLGGINLFTDRPVRVGDFCSYQGEVGTVEEIGLRSTRIRTLERTVVTIPNAEFSNLKLENYALRDQRRLWTMIGVRYETTPDQLRYVLARLRQILLAHPRVTADPARVRFVGFGAYSLDIEVFGYIDTTDHTEFLAIREDLFLRFMDAVKEAGTGFAFPSSTTYVGRDDGLNEDETRRAEARVAEWRDKRELPFPNFSDNVHREVWNSSDWPPPGSPDSST